MNLELHRIFDKNRSSTGKDLRDLSGWDELSLWRECRNDPEIETSVSGRRYLRLDRNVQGYARLSPSIKREFLTYTVCGQKKYSSSVQDQSETLTEETRMISLDKRDFARRTLERVVLSSELSEEILDNVCFIIAGDIVYDMAHLEPRPESSTGRLVKGSDLDIICVTEDDLSKETVLHLDKAIYREKYLCLVKPDIREEIDYVIKDLNKTRRQLKFDSFEHMVASKILFEGEFLFGNEGIFDRIKEMLKKFSIPERLGVLTEEAHKNRSQAEAFLLEGTGSLSEDESLKLFYTRDEADEIF